MGSGHHLNFTPPPFLLLFFVLVVLCIPVRTLGDDPCEKAICGEGKCVPSNSSIVGYECVCNRGWSKFGLGFIACVVPNCTIDFSCGIKAPPPPPPPPPSPPPPSLLPPLDLPTLCDVVWCGEGTCVVTDIVGYYCQCNAGSTNLLNLTVFPCFKKCSLGIDCNDVSLGDATPPPPPPNGSVQLSKRWSSCMVLLSTIILAWMMYE